MVSFYEMINRGASVGVRAAAAHSRIDFLSSTWCWPSARSHTWPHFQKNKTFASALAIPGKWTICVVKQWRELPIRRWVGSTHCHYTTCVLPERASGSSAAAAATARSILRLEWQLLLLLLSDWVLRVDDLAMCMTLCEIVNKMCCRCTAFLKDGDKSRSEQEIVCRAMVIYCPSWEEDVLITFSDV